MKKGILTSILSIVLAVSLVSSALAEENDVALTDIQSSSEAVDASNGMPNEFTVYNHTPVKSDGSNMPVEHPTGNIIKDKPTDKMKQQSTTNAIVKPLAVYGPYSTLLLSQDKMQVVVDALQSSGSLSSVSYNGMNCYSFTSGSDTIYITTATFYRAQSATINTDVSSAVSQALNSGNSAYTYTTAIKSYQYTYNGMTVYRWSFARLGVRSFFYSNDEIIVSKKVDKSYDFDAYQFSVQDIVQASMKITPTLSLKINNTGTSGLYLGGYEMTGTGEDTSTVDLASIIALGYKTVQTVGSIAAGSLTFLNFLTLYNTAVSLFKATAGTRKSYYSDTVPLSTTGKYSYNCTTPSPYNSRLTGDYYTLKIGIVGTKTSTTNFSAAFSCVLS